MKKILLWHDRKIFAHTYKSFTGNVFEILDGMMQNRNRIDGGFLRDVGSM